MLSLEYSIRQAPVEWCEMAAKDTLPKTVISVSRFHIALSLAGRIACRRFANVTPEYLFQLAFVLHPLVLQVLRAFGRRTDSEQDALNRTTVGAASPCLWPIPLPQANATCRQHPKQLLSRPKPATVCIQHADNQ